MDVVKKIIKPAADISLLTPYEARLGLNLLSTSDANLDDMLELLVRWSSDEISTLTGRDFAKETLVETIREINWDCNKIWLSHFPVVSIDEVKVGDTVMIEDTDFALDEDAGKIIRLNGTMWSDTVEVTYTGGFDLPFEAPPALQQAAILLVREAYYAAKRGDATIRMVGHKEARVIYFDPNALALKAGSSAGSPARRAIDNLLKCYMRFEI